MQAAKVVLLNVDPDGGCAGTCGRIESLTREALATRVTIMDRLPGQGGAPEPDLVLLRAGPGALSRQRLGEALRTVRAAWPKALVLGAVCNLSTNNISELLESLRHGLDDFLCCPFADVDFVARLRHLLPDERMSRSERAALLRDARLESLVGASRIFLKSLARLLPLASSTATVLISGETGVGKELFARAIHYNGARQAAPFVPVNCGALPDHLFENEMFGHARGAYTDASTLERGLLAEAEGGTIFLDEVDTLSLLSQAKLLRFLQDGEYRPLGSSKTLTANVRVIAATNSDLAELVSARSFRQDLFHRLNVLCLSVPPLRERTTDIPLLADHFLARYVAQYGRGEIRLTHAALRKMLSYSWPGNVRELDALLHRAIVFCPSTVLDAADIELPPDATGESPVSAEKSSLRCAKGKALVAFERTYLTSLLAEHHGNVSQAARASGADRRTLQRLLRKHGILGSALQGP